jgi:hypothetical protein
MDIINETSSILVDFEALEWGQDLKHLKEVVMEHINPMTLDMILGSDQAAKRRQMLLHEEGKIIYQYPRIIINNNNKKDGTKPTTTSTHL